MNQRQRRAASTEGKKWQPWLEAVESIRRQFFEACDGFDPLYYGEVASVGLLANAAGKCGLLALPEFSESQIKRKDGVRLGRHDLWLVSPGSKISWLFEFKVCWCEPGTKKRIWQSYNQAIKCAFERPCEPDERRVAATIYVPYCQSYDETRFSKFLQRMETVRDHADLWWRIDGADRPAFIAFHMINDGRSLPKYRLPEDAFE